MGVAPMRVEFLTGISGLEFSECYPRRIVDRLDDIKVNLIDLTSPKINKKAAGKHKDLDDLENLP